MTKKKYEAPLCEIIAEEGQLMQDAVSVDTSAWGDQSHAESRRYNGQLWDDEDYEW
ncbi:MAG: hypothetical protein J5552_02215 [Prevotella sp.]|nr:hypothetical protein [Prevotella sp.]